METAKEYLLNAEIAFSNQQYMEALAWYRKVLERTPDDLYALSRAGAICVPLGQYESALKYFSRARELDPQNGDNAFNYGNACFFNNDYTGAFEAYVDAEKLGCSEDVTAKLYYQMALLCSIRQDTQSALVYFRKCEDADHVGTVSLHPDMISEKLKIYMSLQDYENAAKCAAQLVAAQPSQFRSYMVYFSILMAAKDFDTAEKALLDAEQYAELTEDDRITILLQQASLNVARAQNSSDGREEYFRRAESLLQDRLKKGQLTPAQILNVLMTLAEVHQKAEEYEKAISCLDLIQNGVPARPAAESPQPKTEDEPLSPQEVYDMMQADIDQIQYMIDIGELPNDLGMFAEMELDEYGNPIPCYSEELFASLNEADRTQDAEDDSAEPLRLDLSADVQEKIFFTKLSCYLGLDDFSSAQEYANSLKHSSNQYYNYYGTYAAAMIAKKLGNDPALANRLYSEAIAYFRNKTFENHSDSLAVIFRGRLYAEQGKYEKAEELAMLLAESDRTALLDYIQTCRA